VNFSIITAVYNNRENIADALESVRSQTYPDIEHIIVDGDSNDGTLDILLPQGLCRGRQDMDDRMIIVSEKDNGIYDAINKGIKMATGDIIGLLHSDDLFADEFVLSKVLENFQQKSVDAVYGDLVYVHSSDINKVIRYWKSGEYNPKKMKYGWMPPHPALFVKRDIYEKYGLYDTSLKIASDYEMILRLFWKHKISTAYLPKIITKMRWGGASNKSFANLLTKSKEDYVALKKNDLPLPCFTLALKNIRKIPQFIRNKYI